MIIRWYSVNACDYPIEANVKYQIEYANGTKTGTYGAPVAGDEFNTIAFDALIARLEFLLPDFKRIPNPYILAKNSAGVLRKGFGVQIKQASNVMKVNCNYHTQRTFGIVLCRESMNTDHKVEGIASVEKDLLEDLNLLIQDFETNSTLNSGVMFTGYVDDSGIQMVDGEQAFLYLEAQFNLQLIQRL